MIEAYGTVYAHEGKGHDRLVIDTENNLFAVLDGAGGDELSQAAVDFLPTAIKTAHSENLDSKLFIARIAEQLDNQDERFRRRSTLAMAHVNILEAHAEICFLNMGDTSMFLLNRQTKEFGRIAHTPSDYIFRNNAWLTNATEFLGGGRSAEQIAENVGRIVMATDTRWRLVGVTDGIVDDTGQGIGFSQLEKLVRRAPAKALPNRILKKVDKFDDAAIFVVSH